MQEDPRPEGVGSDASPSAEPSSQACRRRRFLSLAVVVLAIGVAGLTLDAVTSSTAICSSCHEMSTVSDAWRSSAHAGVECVACHQPPRAWYAFPLTLGDRAVLLGRDVVAHFSDRPAQPLDVRDGAMSPMSSEVCLECHTADRVATSGFRILINHPEHAARNETCVSCHVRTAHPVPERGRAITLMAQCYTCHGRPDQPKAGTECGLCHPEGFVLLPTSHQPATWQTAHGKIALKDAQQCPLCHDKKSCTECHGVEMPHPEGWSTKGGGSAHARYDDKVDVCRKCHKQQPDPCSRCHHPAWNPRIGDWTKQHRFEVRKAGVRACMKCHGATWCTRCHVSYSIGVGKK